MRRYLTMFLVLGTGLASVGTGGTSGPVGNAPPPDGWGHDCTNWIVYASPWASGEMCYDPLLGAGGAGWRVCATGDPVVWPGLDIELWIEMECAFTWDATHVQIHRASDYSSFYIQFHGTSSCNAAQYIITTPPDDPGSLNFLPFVEDVLGRTGLMYGTDIPLTWEYRIDGGPWQVMPEAHNGKKWFTVDECDHDMDIRVAVAMAYHQEDGYYYLGGPGASICPASPL